MASPHVAGAAAIVAARHPDWAAPRIKDALMSSAAAIAGTPYEVGTGRLDVLTSIDDIDATGSAFLGFYGWPHDGDPVATRTITYRNTGAAPAVLTLDGELIGSDGAGSALASCAGSGANHRRGSHRASTNDRAENSGDRIESTRT